jgi:CRISPR-associated protein Cmr4
VPASSLKGTFADAWNDGLLEDQNDKGETKKVRVKKDGTAGDAAWLFGSDDANNAWAGALQFTEARLLAFPVRSAKGGFAWITCPLMLRRAARDGVFSSETISSLAEPTDEQAVFVVNGPLAIDGQLVLEEYTFKHTGDSEAATIGKALGKLLNDPVWREVKDRLVILSDGMMSYFARNACEIAQHVRIDDETGTAAGGALFNQENVPSETMFYAVIHAFDERTANKAPDQRRKAEEAFKVFEEKVTTRPVFQFGGDASTGLGYCTVTLARGELSG